MRKIIVLLAGVAVVGAPVYVFGTGFGSLVSSFKSPGAWPMGLSYRPGQLYISTFAGTVVWRTTTTGSVINYHPLKLIYNRGVTVGNAGGKTYYWVVDSDTDHIYRYIDNSSTLVGSFPVASSPRGVTFVDAEHMYYTGTGDANLYSVHPITGSVYASYPLSFRPVDAAYDESGYLWIAHASTAARLVYKCTTEGSVLASFSAGEYGAPSGCGFDGEYVWVGVADTNLGRYTILRYAVREEPGIAPASAGRVKALYR